MTSASSTHEAGQSKLVPWDNPEGWDGREVGGTMHRFSHGITQALKNSILALIPKQY